jgi:hypothetical protein
LVAVVENPAPSQLNWNGAVPPVALAVKVIESAQLVSTTTFTLGLGFTVNVPEHVVVLPFASVMITV